MAEHECVETVPGELNSISNDEPDGRSHSPEAGASRQKIHDRRNAKAHAPSHDRVHHWSHRFHWTQIGSKASFWSALLFPLR
ncbi:hypothetical protein PR202_ga03507 [Eleusine coracana subsp. coracana]|uniref:Uncharacterized protein n=1 Tax=Eleusine coracana subsp. coracana TaxID=191504 RepID=A0AAV5BNL3_ELECO|nr:hypothetical protein PR202_ga03507 [Eleusine coracana subsp. coracana]